ncbi:MAG: recombination protein RecO, partial [Sulfurovaceae bacterium]|nr:recombination protein RecO [Sulfurovaceae bacterium]
QIRKISHISFPWIFSPNHLSIWQSFIKLFEPHLKWSVQIDRFYFDLLLKIAKKWHKQNPKRLAVEAYIEILEYEGRLYDKGFCHICENILDERVGLMRAYLLAHPKCIYSYSYDKQQIFKLFNSKSTISIEDNVVNELFNTLLKGL